MTINDFEELKELVRKIENRNDVTGDTDIELRQGNKILYAKDVVLEADLETDRAMIVIQISGGDE